LWRALADREGDPILELGAGTGRVAIDLAKRGHRVTALDNDPHLLAELRRRARGLDLIAVDADARTFELDQTFAACLVPMQTIQLLEGSAGRVALLERVRRHLKPGGLLAIAIAATLDLYEVADDGPHPLPDVCEHDGVVYASQPTAIRRADGHFVIERRRETVDREGRRQAEDHAISLDLVTAAELEREARSAGLRPSDRATIAATRDYAGSEVVILRG
jgi:SAM-dependent methyltransferase